jgi:uncharacterized protein
MFARRGRKQGVRLFFATDIHGSERCFRKWLNAATAYRAQVLILGGDITGKTLVPIVGDEEGWHAEILGERIDARSRDELEALRARFAAGGRYSVVVDPAEAEALSDDETRVSAAFETAMRERVKHWVALAEERLGTNGTVAAAMLGNDDPPFLADVLRSSDVLQYAEDGIVRLPDGREVVSCGYSTPTPWNTIREIPDKTLGEMIERITATLERPDRAIFNFHCPPADTHLDQAPRLDADLRPVLDVGGLAMHSVGSRTVREAIERHQPTLGLHGHVHESAAAQELGRTLCINPGSEYGEGVLRGALVEFEPGDDGVRSWQITHG